MFRLLGPVAAEVGAGQVALGSQRDCLVFAALSTNAGRVVPVDTLVNRVWGGQPPERARRTLHTYLTRTRRTLDEVARVGGGPAAVVHRNGGYLLDIDPDRIDLHRFRRLIAGHGRRGPDRRLEVLREAVGLWRGEPLAGLPGDWAARTRQAWEHEHLDATVAWAQAELAHGNPAAVIGPVQELVLAQPLTEPLVAVLMQALVAVGRSAEALDRYAALRCRLADALGTDAGPELRAIHEAILREELTLPPTKVPLVRTAPAPAQLPGDVPGFAGRADHLASLDTLLATATAAAPTAVVIAAVSGTAGVGKTALAMHWAHRVADRFPDGQLYVNLRGFHPGGQALEPATALRGFLDALGVPAERIPAELDAQAALYRTLIATRRVLVVLDNARDADHARPLLPGTPTALAVVTSRNQLTQLVAADGAHPTTLDVLSDDEARELLGRRIDPGRLSAEPQAVEKIITACARLPLALALVAARAAVHPTFPLTALATEIAAAGSRSGRLDAGDVLAQVRAVFSWSDTTLTAAAARLFRLLGLHPGPECSAAAAASLTGAALADTGALLAELTSAGLLTEQAPSRYGFHDLLRAYAADLAWTVDSEAERRAAVTRLLDHYTHSAHTAARHVNPTRDPIPVPLTPPAPGAVPEQLADRRAALGWLDNERPVLLAAQQLATDAGLDVHAWQLAWTVDTMLDWRGRRHEPGTLPPPAT